MGKECEATSDLFEERFVELFIELYERDFIEIEDVYLAHKWIQALRFIEFPFPEITNTNIVKPNVCASSAAGKPAQN